MLLSAGKVLPCLSPASIVAVAACCKSLKALLFSDEVWQPYCAQLGLAPLQGATWQQVFSREQALKCRECAKGTPYVFKLIGPHYRLCTKCEHENPKYALVTALEAIERHGLSAQQLAELPAVETCNTRFFLRAHVQAVVMQEGKLSRASGGDEESGGSSTGDETVEDDAAAASDASLGEDADAEARASAAAERKAAEKAMRKEQKKQAKLQARMKRQARSEAAAASRRGGNCSRGASPARDGRTHQAGADGKSSRRNDRRRGGRGMGQHGRGRMARGATVAQSGEMGVDCPLEGMLGSSPKVKSGWLLQRERIMEEWGPFAISGLALADAQ